MDGGTAPISALKIDAINSALWALAGYNLAFEPFVELRQMLQAKKNNGLVAHLDSALGAYLQAECAKLYPPTLSDDQVDEKIYEAIGRVHIEDGFKLLGRLNEDIVLLELCAYVLLLAGFGSYGSVVWSRFIASIEVQ